MVGKYLGFKIKRFVKFLNRISVSLSGRDRAMVGCRSRSGWQDSNGGGFFS